MAYWRLHYHGIWVCKERLPLITPVLEQELFQYLEIKCCELGGIFHAIGGIENHVHIVFSLHPKYSIADFIGKLKGVSSHWVSYILKSSEFFAWQRGYGVVSFGDRNMEQVVSYVLNQKQHHADQTTKPIMEHYSEEEDGVVFFLDDSEG